MHCFSFLRGKSTSFTNARHPDVEKHSAGDRDETCLTRTYDSVHGEQLGKKQKHLRICICNDMQDHVPNSQAVSDTHPEGCSGRALTACFKAWAQSPPKACLGLHWLQKYLLSPCGKKKAGPSTVRRRAGLDRDASLKVCHMMSLYPLLSWMRIKYIRTSLWEIG